MKKILYETKTRADCTKLNHFLFGRLNKQKHKGVLYVYYNPGLLHDIKYVHVRNGLYIIDKYDEDAFIPVQPFVKKWLVRDLNMIDKEWYAKKMQTGLAKWQKYAKKKEIKINWGKFGKWALKDSSESVKSAEDQ